MTTPRLVLWDVDHTLLDTGGVGSEIYAAAFEEVTGKPLEHQPEITGRTEPVIFREALAANGITDPGAYYPKFARAQADGYAQRTDELRTRGHALPGAANVLADLAGRPGVIQTVLSGNTRESAEIKLATFDLDQHLDLTIGAYGTDNDDRPRLVNIARTRAMQAHNVHLGETNTVIIGDTVSDVRAGRDGGAYVIAVATGRTTTTELADAGADAVFADLTQLDVIPTILGDAHR